MAVGKKLTKEDEILLQNFSRTVSTKSSALFYANAFFVSAIPLCKCAISTVNFYFGSHAFFVSCGCCIDFREFLRLNCFRAVLEDSPNGPLLLWNHVRCNDFDQYLVSGVCLQEREIPIEA